MKLPKDEAENHLIATFHWMGLSDGDARTTPRFNQQDLVDAIIKGYYGEEGFTGIASVDANPNQKVNVYTLSGVCIVRNVNR